MMWVKNKLRGSVYSMLSICQGSVWDLHDSVRGKEIKIKGVGWVVVSHVVQQTSIRVCCRLVSLSG